MKNMKIDQGSTEKSKKEERYKKMGKKLQKMSEKSTTNID
jgi:hypothetical protein